MFDVEDRALNEHDSPDREEDTFDPASAEEELATLSAHLDAATYRQLVLIRQLDECGHWANAGATTCAAWLSFRIGMAESAARERLRIAHALRDLPKVADAMRTGTLSYSKVRAIVRVATLKMEDQLLEIAQYATAAQLERICRGVRQQQLLAMEDGEPLDEAELLQRAFESRDLHLRARGDGTVQVVVTLLPDEAQRVFTAVESMRDAMREECPSLSPSHADAFVRLVDVGYEEATIEVAHVSGETASESRGLGADDSKGAATESTSTADRGSAETFAPSRAARSDSAETFALSRAARSDSAETFAPSEDARSNSAETFATAEIGSRFDSAETFSARHAQTPPPSADTAARPATPRKKVSGGDTQRVIIQLAPHLLADGLVANLDDGTWIAPETWRRVACDCALELVKVDEAGAVLDVGRRTRTIPPALARALDVRDAGRCRFPGCNHRRFLDRHHLEHWSRGGETKLDNLLTLCTAHHQLVHEGGWTVEYIGSALTRGPIVSRNRAASRTTSAAPRTIPLQTDGDEVRFFRPDGTPLVWPRPPQVDDAVAELEEAHAELEIGATTGLTRWNGKTPEYAWCVEAVCG